jgi:hypothetical protein
MINGRGMRTIRVFLSILVAWVGAGSLCSLRGQIQATPPAVIIEHDPLSLFTPAAALEFRARVSAPVEWMAVFVRFKGIDEFQARPMIPSDEGSYVLQFDTSVLPDIVFEYYLAAGTPAGIVTFPSSGPAGPLQVKASAAGPGPEVPGDIAPPQEETAPAPPPEPGLPFPVKLSGSGQAVLEESAPLPGAEKFPVAGNIRFFLMPPQQGAFNINIDSNFSYTNTPLAGNNPLDLSNMNAAFILRGHTFRAGDISINESEYSAQGIGRRGFEYAFDDQKAYVHIFAVNSQEVKGFKGFGLPRPEVAIWGGAAGYRILGDALYLKALFITGRDSPSQAVNAVIPEEVPGAGGRQGQVLAVTEESRLWSNLLTLKGEFARSRYDADLDDPAGPIWGNAFTLGTGLASGVLTAGLTYRYVDRDFNSIGLQYLANNRSGLEATVGLTRDIFNLTGSLVTQRDNVADDPTSATTSNFDGSLNMSLAVTPKAQIVLGYHAGCQKTEPGSSPTLPQDSVTDEYSGSFNLMVGESSSFNLTVTSSCLHSQASPETEGSALTLNLGGSLRAGEWLSLSPTLGVSTRMETFTGHRSDTLSAMAVSEVFFLPQVCSMFFTGSYSLSSLPGMGGMPSQTLDLNGGLNIYLNRLVKVEGLLLSLKGNFGSNEAQGVRTTNWRALAQCDLSF